MSISSESTQRAVSADTHSEADTRLRGGWLILARVAWVGLVVYTLTIVVASFPAYIAQLHTLCIGATCDFGQLTPDAARTLHALGLSVNGYIALSVALNIIWTLVWLAAGLVIFWRKSDDWMALLVALMLVMASQGKLIPRSLELSHSAWQWPAMLLVYLATVLFVLFLSLFPNGRFVPRWTRWLVVAWLVVAVPAIFVFNSSPYLMQWSLDVLIGGIMAGLLIAQGYRYWHLSSPVQRQQTKWVVFAIAASILVPMAFFVPVLIVVPSLVQPGSLYISLVASVIFVVGLLIPLSINIAILRYHLWDIDIIIKRTLVYGLLTTCVVGIYVLFVGLIGALFQLHGNLLVSLLATGLVAVLFQPLRSRLQRGVNRLLYGQRDEPQAVLAQLSQRLEATLAPNAIFPTIVETIGQALKLPYATILLKQQGEFVVGASYGKPAGDLFTLPLVYQAETIGQMQLAPRSPGEAFTLADLRLLHEVAHQAELAVHAVQLTTDLQRAREQLVLAREEERRRLRRDLHDGIGPTLASLFQRLDTASRLVPRDPEAAITELQTLKAQVKTTIADIRRLVYALRPPVLDELGLASAIREHAAQLQQPDGLTVSIEAPEQLPPLPAAVEVAAYRIVLEALTNVERHAHAQHCLVRLEQTDAQAFCLEITDDGSGLPKGYHAGVGMTSMRERAAELGGECIITARQPGGTQVEVRLPLPKE